MIWLGLLLINLFFVWVNYESEWKFPMCLSSFAAGAALIRLADVLL